MIEFVFIEINLVDLLTAAGNLNESNEAVSVCRFAELIEDDDLFNSNNTDLKFEDHDKLEFLQVATKRFKL